MNGLSVMQKKEAYKTGQYVYLPQQKLKLHPDNIRRYYPPDDVQEIAQSIKAGQGVLQALLVVPDQDAPETYFVVDGNMRLAGGRLLGNACPSLKCEVISANRAKQLLMMAATSHHHYPKDPISEAIHYRRLIEEEGVSIKQVTEGAGVSEAIIKSRLKLLELDQPIQEMVAQGELPKDQRVTEALLSIPNTEARIKLAEAIVVKRLPIPAAEAAAANIAQKLGGVEKKKRSLPLKTVSIAFFSKLVGWLVGLLESDAKLLSDCGYALEAQGDSDLAARAYDRAKRILALVDIAKNGTVQNGR